MSLPIIHEITLNNKDDQSIYVMDMDVSCDSSSFAVSSAGVSNDIPVFDPNTGGNVTTLSGHVDVINSVAYSFTSPSLILSASTDKSVCLYDCRTSSQPSVQLTVNAEVYSAVLGFSDTLIAVGIGSAVAFYDLRNLSTPLGSYDDCHNDTVLQVKFHPLSPNYFHSAGEDGLICTFDTGVAAEEDAVVSICNTESPVSRIGFFGNGLEGIYALSTVETATCWHFPSSQRLVEFSSIREAFDVDYIVDCWGSSQDPDELCMMIGSHGGQCRIFSADPSGLTPLVILPSFDDDNQCGHNDTVRCCRKIGESGNRTNMLLTGGEDSKICMWRLGTSQSENSDSCNLISTNKKEGRRGIDSHDDDNDSKRLRRI